MPESRPDPLAPASLETTARLVSDAAHVLAAAAKGRGITATDERTLRGAAHSIGRVLGKLARKGA
jgi:hypothetical protein